MEKAMRVDLYTKVVLTIIASSVLYLCRISTLPIAHAEGQPTNCGHFGQVPCGQPVIVVGWQLAPTSNGFPVTVLGPPVAVKADRPLPVGIASTGAKFDSAGFVTGFTNDPLPVHQKP